MIKKETLKVLRKLVNIVVDRVYVDKRDGDAVEIATYDIYDEAEKFVKAFRKNELKIDD